MGWVVLGRDASPWVPTCTDLTPRLRTELGGEWTVTDPDGDRDRFHSSSTCTISFVTADQRYTGGIDLFTIGAPDPDAARHDVDSYRCGGTDVQVDLPRGYHAFRICSATTSMRTLVSVYAAKGDRRVTASVTVNLRDDVRAATTYARDLSRLAADRALTMARPE
ncbi:hypothetical protein [Actinoplanes teichomyceticus]|uniref:hypothetical protein n=1 Tax=Actinoplanes teichomyceticus TaxID=1867 RepID=UPI0013DDCED8|nr:hypothetical protein [Actinoplanes teichomyceticus]